MSAIAYKIHDPSVVKLFETVGPHFEKFKKTKNVEMELRFGKIHNKKFEPSISKNSYDRILKGLLKYKDWEDVKKSETSVYYKKDKRIIVDDDTGDQHVMSKKNIRHINHDLDKSPFDVRFSISTETPLDDDDDDEGDGDVMDHVRIKSRTSFIRKNLSIDITKVSGEPTDIDDEEEAKYEVEFEIIDPTKINDAPTLFNIIYKIRDVLKLLE
jgi:hypothetical protein